MTGCKINSRMMPIITPLKNGDIVEILTSDNSKGPSRDWLKFVKSTSAKNKIQSWFKKAQKAENIEKGKELIEKELKRIGMTHTSLFKQEYIEPMLERYKYKNLLLKILYYLLRFCFSSSFCFSLKRLIN